MFKLAGDGTEGERFRVAGAANERNWRTVKDPHGNVAVEKKGDLLGRG